MTGFARNYAYSLDDFGAYPVAMDFYPDGYEGSRREIRLFKHATSGWLSLYEAVWETPFALWRKTLPVCMTDYGQIIMPSVALRLLKMPVSYPFEVQHDPPEEMEEAAEESFRLFQLECGILNMRLLEQAQEQADREIENWEQETKLSGAAIAKKRQVLRMRRLETTNRSDRDRIGAEIERLFDLETALAYSLRRKAEEIRQGTVDLEREIFDADETDAELTHCYTVHWTMKPMWRGVTERPPLGQEEMYRSYADRMKPDTELGNDRIEDMGITGAVKKLEKSVKKTDGKRIQRKQKSSPLLPDVTQDEFDWQDIKRKYRIEDWHAEKKTET